ncbi:unnamed protein product [Euphydryas editha]|uniref:Uncharacterized protein n=1 Tax=Euphydryas editha TaxID=104508 RepID=A0AAU9URD1_EUPED|nr:unnamed protein product [Euphydryas editha]
MKRSLARRIQKTITSPTSKTKDMKLQREVIRFDRELTKSMSCPSLKHSRTTEKNFSLRQTSSLFHFRECKLLFQKCRTLTNCMDINLLQIRAASTNAKEKSSSAVKNLGSVCACPSPNCCLPPPCNTPPKCLQYMTGYYYYPYGTWFCGPYHVSTGSCPCSGPVKPCPGDPCAPICCKPLSCCGVCGVGGPFQQNNTSNAYNPWHFGSANMYSSYNTYTTHPYMDYNSYNPYNSYTPYGYYNSYDATPPSFGPCFNVPITPIPVTHPMTSESCQTNTESSPAKSSISWPLSKANINQYTKVSSSKNTIGNTPCSKNLTPTPLRSSPPPSYYSKSSLSKTNPYTKPRINARTLQSSNSIGICYFSTKYIKKYANKGSKLSANESARKNLSGDNKKIITDNNEVKTNPFNYWSLLGDNGKRKT